MNRLTDERLEYLAYDTYIHIKNDAELRCMAQELLELRREKESRDSGKEATNLLASISGNVTLDLMKANKKIKELRRENGELKKMIEIGDNICKYAETIDPSLNRRDFRVVITRTKYAVEKWREAREVGL